MQIFKDILVTLMPWIWYIQLVKYIDVKLVCLICITALVIIGYKYLKKGFVISWATIVCFLVIFTLNLTTNQTFLKEQPWLIANFCFTLIAYTSLILKKPFTMQYAKEYVSSEKWSHPAFMKINVILTSVWLAIFFLSFILRIYVIFYPQWKELISIIVYINTMIGILFTSMYPKYARSKAPLTIWRAMK